MEKIGEYMEMNAPHYVKLEGAPENRPLSAYWGGSTALKSLCYVVDEDYRKIYMSPASYIFR